MSTRTEAKTIEDYFWEKVDRRGPDDCWIWTAGKSGGYGKLHVGKINVSAHRFSWLLHNGPVPGGVLVFHRCKSLDCVNPRHLFVGKDKRSKRTVEERFWMKVIKTGEDDCWTWTGTKHRGHGQLNVNKKLVAAHRISWEIHNGPIPDGMIIRHSCKDFGCVNPNHLWIGTHHDNNERKTAADRFWEKIEKTDYCWVWTGCSNSLGYGTLYVHGRNTPTHRLSWELHNGPIPDGMNILHRCDNPPCANPDHLFLGTQADNVADMIAKGRDRKESPFGEAHGRSKLTEKKVREIRSKYPVRTVTQLMDEYKISRSQLTRIVRRESWKHVV